MRQKGEHNEATLKTNFRYVRRHKFAFVGLLLGAFSAFAYNLWRKSKGDEAR